MRTGIIAVIVGFLAAAGLALAQEAGPVAPLTAATAWTAGDFAEGEAQYAVACARCHETRGPLAAGVPGDNREAKVAWLWDFLASHNADDPAARADIIVYLLTISADTAWFVGDELRGEATYATACAQCHASSTRLAGRVPGDTREAKVAWLWDFLATHNAEDPEARADLIVHVLAE